MTQGNLTPNNLQIFSQIPGIRLYLEDPKEVIRRQIRRTFWIIGLALILATILMFLAIIEINQKSTKVLEKQNELAITLQNTTFDSSLEKNWQALAPYSDQIRDALPLATNLLAYQSALENSAQKAGVKISVTFATTSKTSSNLPGSPAPRKTFNSLDHNLEIRGGWENINNFINDLENLAYFVQINSFNIVMPQGQSQEATANLSLKIYTQ